jgi:hypothetical protein
LLAKGRLEKWGRKPTLKGGKGFSHYRAENANQGWNLEMDVMKPAHEEWYVSSL